MKIILTRHWETEETKMWILQWHLSWKLTELGLLQANKLWLRLKDEKIDIIFSSDLARSWDTASEIHKYISDIPLSKNEFLRERSFWIFEWKNKNEIGFYSENMWYIFENPENWETIEQVYIRAKIFFESIFPEFINKTILIVCHDDIWKALISVITWKMIKDIKSIWKATISIFKIDEYKNCKIEVYSSSEHLV